MARTARKPDPQFEDVDDEELFEEVIMRLNRDLREASETLSEKEAGYLVAAYYNLQELRIRCAHQIKRLGEAGKPSLVITWLERQARVLEGQIRASLDRFSAHHKFGPWPRSVVGIGPVITAGLIAHTHMEHLTTAGHFWSFAGLNPDAVWEKGKLRPWNSALKVLSWKIGHSFMMVQKHKDDVYGKVYRSYKDKYIARNESGGFKENAANALRKFNYSKTTDAYKAYIQGNLPPGHIDAMARRAASKLFLAHYWEMCWRIDNPGKEPVLPYPIVHLGHAHVIHPPRWEDYIPKAK